MSFRCDVALLIISPYCLFHNPLNKSFGKTFVFIVTPCSQNNRVENASVSGELVPALGKTFCCLGRVRLYSGRVHPSVQFLSRAVCGMS